jgi:lipopolysaccharide transport system permease protein
VIYPSSIIPAQWRWLYSLNPMVGVVEGFRWSLLGSSRPAVSTLLVSLVVVVVVVVTGLLFFKRSERQFADVV